MLQRISYLVICKSDPILGSVHISCFSCILDQGRKPMDSGAGLSWKSGNRKSSPGA